MPALRPEARLLGLATWILDQGRPVSRREIYERFAGDYRGSSGAREKKFGRDKADLEKLGFVLVGEPLGDGEDQFGYRIDLRASTLPVVTLGPDEAAVVWAAGLSALRLSDHPLRDDLEGALRKLAVGTRALPPRVLVDGEPIDPGGAPSSERWLARIVDAWERRKRIRISYYRVSSDEVLDREVDVYGYASRRGEWLFAGRCHLRNAVRVFYLSRVSNVAHAATGNRPGDPDYAVPAGFDVRHYSRQEPWDYHEHAPVPAAVRFTGSLARIAGSLLPRARIERGPDGSRTARLPVENLDGLVRQALAWGEEAELVEPAEGRARAREILDRLAGEGP